MSNKFDKITIVIPSILVVLSIWFAWFALEYGTVTFVKLISIAKGYEYDKNLKISWDHPLFSQSHLANRNDFDYHPYRTHANTPLTQNQKLGTDAYGFVHNGTIREYKIPKPTNVVRIILLGGSGAYGWGASSNEKTITAQLESQLNSFYSHENLFEVINAGVGNYNTSNEVTYWAIDLLEFEPDIVITFDGFNDVWNTMDVLRENQVIKPNYSNYQFSLVQKLNDEAVLSFHFKGFLDAFIQRAFYNTIKISRVLKNRIPKTLNSKKNELQSKFPTITQCPDEFPHVVAHQYIENLKTIASIAQGRNIKAILTLQPIYWEALGEDHPYTRNDYTNCFLTAYAQMEQKLMSEFQKININTYSFVKPYMEKKEYFTDQVHLTDQAQQLVANHFFHMVSNELGLSNR